MRDATAAMATAKEAELAAAQQQAASHLEQEVVSLRKSMAAERDAALAAQRMAADERLHSELSRMKQDMGKWVADAVNATRQQGTRARARACVLHTCRYRRYPSDAGSHTHACLCL